MKPAEIERILGLPVGSTMQALVALAKKLQRRDPSAAFLPFGLIMSWLKTPSQKKLDASRPGGFENSPSLRRLDRCEYLATPEGVLPFAGYDDHLGFLATAGSTTDDCPIVRVQPALPDRYTEVVAPTLLDWLGVVAACRTTEFGREDDDLELLHTPETTRLHPTALAEATELANALRDGIPGLRIPRRPSEVIRAAESPSFTLSVPPTDASRRQVSPSAADLAESGLRRARHALEAGAYVRAVAHLSLAVAHPPNRPRALALRVRARLQQRDHDAATEDFETLAREWLDDSPSPDGPHPRAVVPQREMLELLDGMNLGGEEFLREKIQAATEPPEVGGDFL